MINYNDLTILVFLEKELMAVVHSRQLQLPNTAADTLERGFQVLYYNNISVSDRNDFKKKFNKFILSVD